MYSDKGIPSQLLNYGQAQAQHNTGGGWIMTLASSKLAALAAIKTLSTSTTEWLTDTLKEVSKKGWTKLEQPVEAAVSQYLQSQTTITLHNLCTMYPILPEAYHQHMYSDKGIPSQLLNYGQAQAQHNTGEWLTDTLKEVSKKGWTKLEQPVEAAVSQYLQSQTTITLHNLCTMYPILPEAYHQHMYSDKGIPSQLLNYGQAQAQHNTGGGWIMTLASSKLAALGTYSATISSPHQIIGAAQRSAQVALLGNFQLTKPHILVYSHIAMVAAEQTKLGGNDWQNLLNIPREKYDTLNSATLLSQAPQNLLLPSHQLGTGAGGTLLLTPERNATDR
eukprot:gene27821-12544_t